MNMNLQVTELEGKLIDLKKLARELGLDLSEEISKLEVKINELQRNADKTLSPYEKLSIAKHLERPTSLDYIEDIFDGFIELHGDRYFSDDSAIVSGIASLEGIPVTVIAQQKGRNTKENIKRNFGMPHPEGYRKALRLMKQAEKFKRPIICFVDTPGAYCGIEAEERGQGEAIARNLFEMSALKVPIITVFIGEGGSGGALALAVADRMLMLEHAVYSILSPEGFATILWKDSSRAKEAAEIMKITSQDLFELKIIDKILEEPLGGAHKDPNLMSKKIKTAIVEELMCLLGKDINQILEERYDRFRAYGVTS